MKIFDIRKALGSNFNAIQTIEDDDGVVFYSILSFCKVFCLTDKYDNIVKSIPTEYIYITCAKDPVTYCTVGKPAYYVTLDGLEHIILNISYQWCPNVEFVNGSK